MRKVVNVSGSGNREIYFSIYKGVANMFETLTQSLPEVISTKWMVGAIVLLLGLKVGAKGFMWAKKASTGMLVAALLFLSGLGGTGYTVGDIAANWDSPVKAEAFDNSLTNKELLALVKEGPQDGVMLRQVLDYAAVRDSKAVVVVNESGKVVKVHKMPQLTDQPKITYVSHNGKVQAAPASLTTKEETQAEVKAAGPNLPIQWSAGLACVFIALTVIGVVTASRTANKLKAEKA
jgi:hypothetical protein